MFVHFRETPYGLAMSLVENRRENGRICHKHVASLGSIETPPSVAARIEFWRGLHERLAQLSNRLDAEMRGKVTVAVHARVPMVTPEELAVPRYLEFVRELPTTESGKVQKYRLRERGVTERTWDREAAHDRRTRQADASKQSRP
jgi:hypothetical protein